MVSLPVTVVVPTIGRPRLLTACLASIAACEPTPGQVAVVDQSGSAEVAGVVEAAGATLVSCPGRGAARAINVGLRAARHHIVLVTNDDCTVARDWVNRAWAHSQEHPGNVITGQVRPGGGDADAVPSVNVDPTPREYVGEPVYWALYGGNMVLPRDPVLAIGGFDERDCLLLAAEDNDLCYRWTKAGYALRYRPDLVVWHHDWRSPEELYARYVEYGRGQGAFYAKHLRSGDLQALRFLARDLRSGLRGTAAGIVRRRLPSTDPRRGLLRGLPGGLARGWLEDRRIGRTMPC